MKEFIEGLGLIIGFILGIVVVVYLLFIIVGYSIGLPICQQQSKIMNMNYDFGILTGCMIEYEEDKWINRKRYIVNNETD